MASEVPQSFWNDLAASCRAMGRAPGLVAVTLALYWVGNLLLTRRGLGMLLSLGIFVVVAGFNGTQRVWFTRLFRRQPLPIEDVESLTARFVPRFVVLGATALPPLVVLALLGLVARASGPGTASAQILSTWFRTALVVVALALDIIWTFVTPALALTTPQVGEAYRVGLKTLRQTWPGSAWYALTPGLALVVFSAVKPEHGVLLRLAVGTPFALLALCFKGAAVAFYLRLHPEVGDFGAAPPRAESDSEP